MFKSIELVVEKKSVDMIYRQRQWWEQCCPWT